MNHKLREGPRVMEELEITIKPESFSHSYTLNDIWSNMKVNKRRSECSTGGVLG